jgi:LCP family protein required for cell wall assembly
MYKRPSVGQIVVMFVGLGLAISLFLFTREFVACWRLTALGGIPLLSCLGENSSDVSPTSSFQPSAPAARESTTSADVSIPPAELPPPWDGAGRVNILLMGYDYGEWSSERACPCRTDSMIVLTIDPISKTAGMLSLQRDLWVNIPGFGYNKINAANYFGDLYKLPGGGPELARKTVENFLGISIPYYVLLDFYSFTTVIDDIGGIDIDVPQQIKVDPLGEHNTVTLEPGINHLDGQLALAYARMRHTANDDIDRSSRQQQVILAVRDKMLDKKNFLTLLSKSLSIYNQISAGVKTNFPSIENAGRLAVLAMQVPLDQIQKGVINYSMAAPGQVAIEGQTLDILRPFPDKIRELVQDIFSNGSMRPLAAANPSEMTLEEVGPLMQQESATVIVVNATQVEGIASKTADYLKSQGMNVINFGNMKDFPDHYNRLNLLPRTTSLIVHIGKPYVMIYLMKLMDIYGQNNLFIMDYDPNAPSDINLVIGTDWVNNNPMP